MGGVMWQPAGWGALPLPAAGSPRFGMRRSSCYPWGCPEQADAASPGARAQAGWRPAQPLQGVLEGVGDPADHASPAFPTDAPSLGQQLGIPAPPSSKPAT